MHSTQKQAVIIIRKKVDLDYDSIAYLTTTQLTILMYGVIITMLI